MTRSLTLTEHQTSDAVALSPEELNALLEIRSLRVQPTRDGAFIVTPGSEVGVIELPTLRVTIEPKLTIDQVLFLISYALDPVRWREEAAFPTQRGLVEWLVPVFVAQARRAFARGLAQGYREEEDSLMTIRGRLRFDEQLRRRFGHAPPAEVQFDEYTEDIELNRVVKAAARRLARLRLRHEESRRSLLQLDFALERVRDVAYDPRSIPTVAFTRLTNHYKPVIALATLILQSTSLTLGATETARGTAFLVDMNRVFEDFVVTALREALRVSEREFPQGMKGRRLRLTTRERIVLKPDISWWDQNRCTFVGDVKYKRISLEGYQNADIYQLLTYSVAANLPGGILLYAKGERPTARHRVRHAGKVLDVVALTLDGTPDEVLAEIREVAASVRAFRRSALRLAPAA